MIGTSIYIEKYRLNRLRKAADRMQISESEMLSILLMRSRNLFGDEAVTGKTVDYQEAEKSDFIIHHIEITESDYEIATGRRYLFKISVSFIFRLAIDYFLTGIINEWIKKHSLLKQDWLKYLTNIYYVNFTIKNFKGVSVEFWTIPWPEG